MLKLILKNHCNISDRVHIVRIDKSFPMVYIIKTYAGSASSNNRDVLALPLRGTSIVNFARLFGIY